ncbi:MAG: polysaccharide deacetylase family protein [Chryseolinea sp.]
MSAGLTVLLSFDIEEFDMPLEYGKNISIEQQLEISARGTQIILDILKANNVKATFFSTVVFANHADALIRRLVEDGHELASHGYYHSSFEVKHLLNSRLSLEKIGSTRITGFRMPRMKPVDDLEIQRAGYTYNSSLNPTYLPGRYNNFNKPRTIFRESEVLQVPASVTPFFRFPLFWLSFHNLPLPLYQAACERTVKKDCYLNIYFHPWEFTDLSDEKLGMPWFVKKNSGQQMINRFADTISWMKGKGYQFSRINSYLEASANVPRNPENGRSRS